MKTFESQLSSITEINIPSLGVGAVENNRMLKAINAKTTPVRIYLDGNFLGIFNISPIYVEGEKRSVKLVPNHAVNSDDTLSSILVPLANVNGNQITDINGDLYTAVIPEQ